VSEDDDAPCTDCGDTGWTYQTERRCSCGAAPPEAAAEDDTSLPALLRRAREYVADSLDAHEHSDGRDLLDQIDAALTESPQP